TNALPFLVKWACYEPPAWGGKLDSVLNHLPSRIGSAPAIVSLRVDRKTSRIVPALYGLSALGPDARPAIPHLCRVATHVSVPPIGWQKGNAISAAVMSVGTNSFPAFRAILADHRHPHRLGAVTLISRAGFQPEFFPELAACTRDPDPRLALAAIQ